MNEMPKIPKVQMPIVSLADQMRQLTETGKRVNVLWQEDDTLAFVARGREYRSEFHINPSDEVMYPIKGDMRLHYRTPEGKEEVAIVPEGSVIHTPAGFARHAMRCCTRSRPWSATTAPIRYRRPTRTCSTAKRTAPASSAAT
jgi:hypothetical protein